MLSRRFSFATTTRRIALTWSVIIESQRQNCPVGRNKEKFPNIRSNVLEILNVSSMFHTLIPRLIDLPLPLITSGVRSIPREDSVRIPGGRRGRRADGASSGPGHPSSPWPLARKRPRDRHVVGTLKTRRREETIINKVPLLPRKLWFTQNKLFRYPPVAAIIIRITIYEMLPALSAFRFPFPLPHTPKSPCLWDGDGISHGWWYASCHLGIILVLPIRISYYPWKSLLRPLSHRYQIDTLNHRAAATCICRLLLPKCTYGAVGVNLNWIENLPINFGCGKIGNLLCIECVTKIAVHTQQQQRQHVIRFWRRIWTNFHFDALPIFNVSMPTIHIMGKS